MDFKNYRFTKDNFKEDVKTGSMQNRFAMLYAHNKSNILTHQFADFQNGFKGAYNKTINISLFIYIILFCCRIIQNKRIIYFLIACNVIPDIFTEQTKQFIKLVFTACGILTKQI